MNRTSTHQLLLEGNDKRWVFYFLQNTFFTESTYGVGREFHGDFFAILNKGLLLKIWFPNLFGLFLRKGNRVAVLFAFTGIVTLLHEISQI